VAKGRMKPNSIIVLTLPGSLTYISPELRDLNGCILDTLKSVYRHVRIIPGDINLYLASDSETLDKVTLQEINGRLVKRKINTGLITRPYIEYRLDEKWLQWFRESMKGRKIRVNSDFLPSGVFFALSHWNSLFSPYLTLIFRWFEGLSFTLSSFYIGLITLFVVVLMIRMPYFSRQSLTYSIFTSGLTGMIFSLAILFTFQTLYGYLYHQIGLLIAIFMFGIALGSFLITKRLDRIEKETHFFLKTEAAIILFSILFPFLFLTPSHHLANWIVYLTLYGVILIVSLLSGLLLGLQFPLAAKMYMAFHKKGGALGQTAGLLYGADLFGGFFGGLLGGVLLLPILGLKNTCFLMAMIKGSSGLLFLLFIKIQRSN
jgi:spermidine synthase